MSSRLRRCKQLILPKLVIDAMSPNRTVGALQRLDRACAERLAAFATRASACRLTRTCREICRCRLSLLSFAKFPIKNILCLLYLYDKLNSFSLYSFNMYIARNSFSWVYCISFQVSKFLYLLFFCHRIAKISHSLLRKDLCLIRCSSVICSCI